jgi:hypothetical protein
MRHYRRAIRAGLLAAVIAASLASLDPVALAQAPATAPPLVEEVGKLVHRHF